MGVMRKLGIMLDAYQKTEDKKKIFKKVYNALIKGGFSGLKHTIISVSGRHITNQTNSMDIYDYQQELIQNNLKSQTSITVIIEIKDNKTDITGTIDSLKNQTYMNYKVIIIAPGVYSDINGYNVIQYKNHPGEVYNKVISMIVDDYLLLINGSNILHPDALLMFAQKVEDKLKNIIYCDECIFDGKDGHRIKYFIKPEYSQIYQLSSLYIQQGVVFSSRVIKEVGGFSRENICFSARINDAILKVIQNCESVHHINRILLLRNSFSEEADKFYDSKAIDNTLVKMGYIGKVLMRSDNFVFSFKFEEPKVSIIIPTDDIKMISNCIESIILTTDYPIYDINIVSNKRTCDLLNERYRALDIIHYALYEDDFNYSKKCNFGAQKANGDILIFMQDSVLIEQESWLRKIVSCFVFERVGAVSPKIEREDGTIRYAGIISGGFGFFPIPFNGEPNTLTDGVNELAFTNREISILSATCLAVRRQVYHSVDGFNEKDTPDKFGNVDFSYKVKKQNLFCLYCAESTISVTSCEWYDSWFKKESNTAYLYIMKNYIKLLENDIYFTKEMKYHMLKNVPHDNAFYSSNIKNRSGHSILLVSHELSLTGAPIALHYAAKTIGESGNYPVVVSPYDGNLRKELLSDGIDVIIDSTINGSDFWLKWAKNFDLIIVSTLVQYHSIVQLKDMNIPVLWWVHESRESYLIGANKLIPKEVGKNIHIYCGGGYAKNVMKEFRPTYNTEELLYCVPDYASYISTEFNFVLDNIKDKFVFSIIGTIEERKGQDIFAKAIMDMPKEYIEKCKFFIIGRKINDIIYDSVIRIKKMYPDQVTLINEVTRDEIRDVYNQSDAIVCASRDDPMPVFITESLMLSKIAICSENTGTASLLQDGVNGFVYKNNDYKELMEKMLYVIDNANNLEKIKIEGRKTYEKYFTKEAFDSSMAQIIDTLINEVKK